MFFLYHVHPFYSWQTGNNTHIVLANSLDGQWNLHIYVGTSTVIIQNMYFFFDSL